MLHFTQMSMFEKSFLSRSRDQTLQAEKSMEDFFFYTQMGKNSEQLCFSRKTSIVFVSVRSGDLSLIYVYQKIKSFDICT